MMSLYGFDSKTWKKWQEMAEQCQRLLTEQPITPAGPGSILKDVDSFMEFVGTEGIATKSRNNTLPIGRLMELNQKSSYPIELTLKRALLREYDFRYRDQRGTSRIYNHPDSDDGPYTSQITVAETGLPLKDEMLFTFDYGDNWQFKVRLEAVEDAPCKFKQPKIAESAGKAPDQYPTAES